MQIRVVAQDGWTWEGLHTRPFRIMINAPRSSETAYCAESLDPRDRKNYIYQARSNLRHHHFDLNLTSTHSWRFKHSATSPKAQSKMLFSILPSLAALASCAIAAPTPSDTSLDMPHEMPSIEARNNLTALRLASRAADPPGGPITCYGSPPCITDGAASGCIFALELTKGAAHAWAVVVPVSGIFKVRHVRQSCDSAAGRARRDESRPMIVPSTPFALIRTHTHANWNSTG